MKGIQLKLKGEWVALPKDFSLNLEQTNPLFNEQGTFSFPFEVPLEPNRSLFKNIADPFGDIRLKDIDGMEAELWFNGVMLYKGLVETDEEVEFEDSIPMTFLSGNADFMKRIEDLNAQDIPLDREIKIGSLVYEAEFKDPAYDNPIITKKYSLPEHIMMYYSGVNVSDPYPIKPYCNVRVCTSDEKGRYKVLDAKRPFSGVCYYVLYFLDCLFKSLKISVNENTLFEIEDLTRLAFFTTKCDYLLGYEIIDARLSFIKRDDFCGPNFSLKYRYDWVGKYSVDTEKMLFRSKEVYATNKNFPNVSVKNIIEDLFTAFGIKVVYDEKRNTLSLILLKDVFRNNKIENLNIKVLNEKTYRQKNKNIILSYGVSDNTSFNYTDFSNVSQKDYGEIIKKRFSVSDKTLYIDLKTGNSYRIKVNKETGKKPSLFEVEGFRDYKSSDKISTNTQKNEINFSPVIVNDIIGGNSNNTDSNQEQVYATFVDVELKSEEEFKGNIFEFEFIGKIIEWVELSAKSPINYDFMSDNENPLMTYDAGYTLGIMRGPGNESGIEFSKDYDGEGNDSWSQTVKNYAFTSDSCDNYGRFFDYNGTEAGGADQTGRFSLKLVAGKDGFPIDSQYANRGLVSKFLSEYLYFLENRKTVMLEVEMSITQLINIDFLKRYKIGDFVGFINKVSYNMTVNGMEDVVIEMYTL